MVSYICHIGDWMTFKQKKEVKACKVLGIHSREKTWAEAPTIPFQVLCVLGLVWTMELPIIPTLMNQIMCTLRFPHHIPFDPPRCVFSFIFFLLRNLARQFKYHPCYLIYQVMEAEIVFVVCAKSFLVLIGKNGADCFFIKDDKIMTVIDFYYLLV